MKNKERGQGISRASERERVEEGRERESDEAARREGTQRPVCYLRAEKDSRALNQMEDNNRP